MIDPISSPPYSARITASGSRSSKAVTAARVSAGRLSFSAASAHIASSASASAAEAPRRANRTRSSCHAEPSFTGPLRRCATARPHSGGGMTGNHDARRLLRWRQAIHNEQAVVQDQTMRRQSTWPVRYRVTVQPVTGNPRDFYVLTWLGPEKAVMMAAHTDGRGYGSSDGIYDIVADELGPAARDQDGLVALGGDLHDRMEF